MNTTTEKRVQVTLDGPAGCGITIVGAAIIYALTQRGAQVSYQDADDPAPLRRTWAPDIRLDGFVVDIRTAGAPGTPITVADRYADRYADAEPTDAELAEAVRGACAALRTAIKAARDAGLTVAVDAGRLRDDVQVTSVTRPL